MPCSSTAQASGPATDPGPPTRQHPTRPSRTTPQATHLGNYASSALGNYVSVDTQPSRRSGCRNYGSRSPAASGRYPVPKSSPRSAPTPPPPSATGRTCSTSSSRPPTATPGSPPPDQNQPQPWTRAPANSACPHPGPIQLPPLL